ncbi:M16 family metallopeptidase [Streptomyces olivaceoviridis]
MPPQRPSGERAVLGQYEESRATTTLCLAAGFGSRHDPPGHGGTAHLLEHLLMSASLDGGPSLSERIERLGGAANATTGLDHMFFQAQVLNEDVPEVLAMMSTALLRPRLDDAVLASERQAVLQELAAAAADPSDQVQDAFLESVFRGHPLGRPVGGTAEEIEATDVHSLREAHRDLFLGSRIVLTGAGGTPVANLRRLAEDTGLADALGRPHRRDDEPLAPLAAPTTPSEEGTDSDGFSWLAVGGRAPAADDPRRHAYVVLAHLLGPSSASLLYRRLRGDAGLVYAFFAWSRSYAESGAWRIMAGVEDRNVSRARRIIEGLLAEVAADGPTADDLTAARHQAVMDLVLTTEKSWDHTTKLATETLLGTRPWTVEDGIQALRQVTADQIRDAAAELADRPVTAIRPERS